MARKEADDSSFYLLDCDLRKIRQGMGFTQKQVADIIGTSAANVVQIEKRGNVMVRTLDKYVHALGGELTLLVELPGGRERRFKCHTTEQENAPC